MQGVPVFQGMLHRGRDAGGGDGGGEVAVDEDERAVAGGAFQGRELHFLPLTPAFFRREREALAKRSQTAS